jgi:pSer/pThr/pTyr-binding forkhead associated (FHA) protein
MFALVMVKGPSEGKTFSLDKDSVVIGRHPSVDIVLESPMISRQHARIRQLDGSFFIDSLGSRNPIRLNGQTVMTAAPLAEGDTIQIDLYVFAFRRAGAGAE